MLALVRKRLKCDLAQIADFCCCYICYWLSDWLPIHQAGGRTRRTRSDTAAVCSDLLRCSGPAGYCHQFIWNQPVPFGTAKTIQIHW